MDISIAVENINKTVPFKCVKVHVVALFRPLNFRNCLSVPVGCSHVLSDPKHDMRVLVFELQIVQSLCLLRDIMAGWFPLPSWGFGGGT